MKRLRYFIVLHFLDNDLARRLLSPLYRLAVIIACRLITWRFPNIEVWSRNSIISNDIIPGISDVDLTLYSNSMLSRSQELIIRDIHRLLCFLIPVMGEWNFYYDEDRDILRTYFNPLELSRDPQLARRINQNKEANEIETNVYLLRQWQSDKHYLRDIPKLRTRKWKRIGERTQISISNVNYTTIYEILSQRIVREFSNEKNQICYFPHEWIGENWHKNDFESRMRDLESFSEAHRQICLKQIYWEVSGILCQLPMLDNPQDMNPHFYHLGKLIRPFFGEEEVEKIGRFGYLITKRYSRHRLDGIL